MLTETANDGLPCAHVILSGTSTMTACTIQARRLMFDMHNSNIPSSLLSWDVSPFASFRLLYTSEFALFDEVDRMTIAWVERLGRENDLLLGEPLTFYRSSLSW